MREGLVRFSLEDVQQGGVDLCDCDSEWVRRCGEREAVFARFYCFGDGSECQSTWLRYARQNTLISGVAKSARSARLHAG